MLVLFLSLENLQDESSPSFRWKCSNIWRQLSYPFTSPVIISLVLTIISYSRILSFSFDVDASLPLANIAFWLWPLISSLENTKCFKGSVKISLKCVMYLGIIQQPVLKVGGGVLSYNKKKYCLKNRHGLSCYKFALRSYVNQWFWKKASDIGQYFVLKKYLPNTTIIFLCTLSACEFSLVFRSFQVTIKLSINLHGQWRWSSTWTPKALSR